VTPFLVVLGAAVGAPTRFVLGRVLDGRVHWGTLVVNLAGSFVLGLLTAAGVSASTMALLGTGFCGGLTTYSSFSVQAVDAGTRRGAAYVLMTIAGCLLSAALGYGLGSAVS
jgi:fluoride exporter